MQHLIGRGHRSIAHLAGPPDTPPGRVRLEAYRQALAEAGLAHDESLVRYGTFDREHVAELVGSLFPTSSRGQHPTALFAANDVMAIEAIRTLTRFGWRVPADVAVCGFDNIPEAEVVMPPLTTVDQDAEAIGRRAAELLLERLTADAPLPPREVSIACRLVLRESA
jgi:DNA-binding LacI/PurR family transcriptional regulator